MKSEKGARYQRTRHAAARHTGERWQGDRAGSPGRAALKSICRWLRPVKICTYARWKLLVELIMEDLMGARK